MTAADPAIARLLDTLRRSFDGEAWHGPALADALDGLSAADAARQPIPDAHSPWALVLHLAAWTREVTRRVQGAPSGVPPEGDFPPVPARADAAAHDRAWVDARRALHDARDALLGAVAALHPAGLDALLPIPATGDGESEGVRRTMHAMLVGVAEHNAYHGGQIVLLRRAVSARSAS